jgi:hypothetical protein
MRHQIACTNNGISQGYNVLPSKHLIFRLGTRKRMMIQDDLYPRFAQHVHTVCLGDPASVLKLNQMRATDQILYASTRVMLRGPVDQRLYDPIPELREQY